VLLSVQPKPGFRLQSYILESINRQNIL